LGAPGGAGKKQLGLPRAEKKAGVKKGDSRRGAARLEGSRGFGKAMWGTKGGRGDVWAGGGGPGECGKPNQTRVGVEIREVANTRRGERGPGTSRKRKHENKKKK